MPVKQLSCFEYTCDLCGGSTTAEGRPEDWLDIYMEHLAQASYVVCPACQYDAVAAMLYDRTLAAHRFEWVNTATWLQSRSFVLANWENAKCPACKMPWEVGDPLRKSPTLDKWVHYECAAILEES
jgi:hypothetical protein